MTFEMNVVGLTLIGTNNHCRYHVCTCGL